MGRKVGDARAPIPGPQGTPPRETPVAVAFATASLGPVLAFQQEEGCGGSSGKASPEAQAIAAPAEVGVEVSALLAPGYRALKIATPSASLASSSGPTHEGTSVNALPAARKQAVEEPRKAHNYQDGLREVEPAEVGIETPRPHQDANKPIREWKLEPKAELQQGQGDIQVASKPVSDPFATPPSHTVEGAQLQALAVQPEQLLLAQHNCDPEGEGGIGEGVNRGFHSKSLDAPPVKLVQ